MSSQYKCFIVFFCVTIAHLAACNDELSQPYDTVSSDMGGDQSLGADNGTDFSFPDDGVQDMSATTDMDHGDIAVDMFDMDAADSSPATPQPLIIEENCKCYNEAETCVLFPRYGQIRCQLKGTSCTVKEDCGFGYFCAENGVCECDGSESPHYCAAKCLDNGDCPLHLECDPLGNKCADTDACRDDLDCRSGAYCVQSGEPYKNEKTCEFPPSSGKQLGEECTKDFDCKSLGCVQGKCAARCLSDIDCPSMSRCAWSLQRGAYCNESLVACSATCSDPNTFCWDNCAPPKCRNTSDCEEGDCIILAAGKVSLGTCATGPEGINLCKPNEWREDAEDPYCRTTRCALDVECTGAERCLPTRLGTGEPFCARQVRPVP